MTADRPPPIEHDHGRRDFLRYLFLQAGSDELIELRWKDERTGNWRHKWFQATEGGVDAACACAARLGPDIYFGAWPRTRQGGRKDDVAEEVCWLWCDLDGSATPLPQALKPTVTVASGRPRHYHVYWRLGSAVTKEEAIRRVRALVSMLGGDPNAQDIARVLRLPGHVNTKPEANGAVCELTDLDPACAYDLEEVDAVLGDFLKPTDNESRRPAQTCEAGELVRPSEDQLKTVVALMLPRWKPQESREEDAPARHRLALCLSGYLAVNGWPQDAVEAVLRQVCTLTDDPEAADRIRACDDTFSQLAANEPVAGWTELSALLPAQALALLEDVAKPSGDGDGVAENSDVSAPEQEPLAGESRGGLHASWPAPLGQVAFRGIAGELVRLIEPHTEADPAALLISFFVAFGNAAGRSAHFVADGARHYTNLFVTLVGDTSRSRKGSSWAQVRRPFETVDADWANGQVIQGLSSGEGLIWAVRDRIVATEPIRKGGVITGYEDVVRDPGVADKRLLVTEMEFASTLRVMRREGNTLSATLRTAWDTGDLRVITKNAPAKATGAHISIVGHITRGEVLRHLDETEAANGFGNRFLWVCVRRSKLLAEGGSIEDVDFGPPVRRLKQAVEFARGVGVMTRDEDARALWIEVYPELSRGLPSLLGAMVARAEAQVMRLACIYALLDRSDVVQRGHLEAALEVWRYCNDSARCIFGDTLGDPVADEIQRVLRATPSGLTRTEVNNYFGRNKSAAQLSRALAALSERGLATCVSEPPDAGRGRPVERWRATRPGE